MKSRSLKAYHVKPYKAPFQLLLGGCLFALLQGCGEDKPSASDLKAGIVAGMNKEGNYFSVSDLDIAAQENKGDSVQPQWKSRFTVTYKTNIPLYEVTGSNNVATFVRETQPAGYTFDVPYIATSTLSGDGKWDSSFYRTDTAEVKNLGEPLERWNGMVVREDNESDKAKYDIKVAELDEKNQQRDQLIAQSAAILKDDNLTKQMILGIWRDRCNGKTGWAGRLNITDDGKAKWDQNYGEYQIDKGIITFTWYKNFNKTAPVQWRINVLTKDNLELAQRGTVCVAKRKDDERI